MLNGIKNFLMFVDENWTTIVVIISLIVAIAGKVRAWMKQSKNEKIENAKSQLKEIMLKLITDAEVDYEDWNKAGSVKRSQVIQKIFMDFPVLSLVADQEALIAWIDEMIDTSLKDLRKIIAENKA